LTLEILNGGRSQKGSKKEPKFVLLPNLQIATNFQKLSCSLFLLLLCILGCGRSFCFEIQNGGGNRKNRFFQIKSTFFRSGHPGPGTKFRKTLNAETL
jgi:hypothetical protein